MAVLQLVSAAEVKTLWLLVSVSSRVSWVFRKSKGLVLCLSAELHKVLQCVFNRVLYLLLSVFYQTLLRLAML